MRRLQGVYVTHSRFTHQLLEYSAIVDGRPNLLR
jgi:hypothetical protein